jgi:hypothetical protein
MQLQRTLAASSTSRYKIIHSNIDNTKPLLIYQIQPTSMWGWGRGQWMKKKYFFSNLPTR